MNDLFSNTPPTTTVAATPLLRVEHLCVRFRQGQQATEAVRDISFEIAAGERLAIVGESGSGKSVTALSILQLLREAEYSGSIQWQGENLFTKSEREMRRVRGADIAMIFQEPMTALNPLFSIGNQIVETIVLHEGVNQVEATKRAIALLARTGIPEPEERFHSYPHQLSGGQRQRAMIAVALACKPKLLLADEPTTALDVTIRAQIMALLADLQREYGMAILLITHDLNLVRSFAQRVAVMEKGQLVECAETETLFQQPQHPYTQRLIQSRPVRSILPVLPIAPVLLAGHALGVAFVKRHQAAWWQVRQWFKQERFQAIQDVQLTLRQGETLGLVGESGSGKTTLAMALLGLQTYQQGEVTLLERPLGEWLKSQRLNLRSKVQVVFQDPYGSLSPRMTVEEIVGEGLALHQPKLSNEQRYQRIVEVLREVGLDRTVLGRYPHEFSGGQRQRIAIARVLILQPQVIVLDEPTSALDVSIQQQVLELLTELQRKYNLSYLFISHDLAVIQAMAHRIMVLKDGRVVEQGETLELLARPQNAYTQRLLAAAQLH